MDGATIVNTAEAAAVKEMLDDLAQMYSSALSQAFLAWHYKHPGSGLSPLVHSTLNIGHKGGKPILRVLSFLGGDPPEETAAAPAPPHSASEPTPKTLDSKPASASAAVAAPAPPSTPPSSSDTAAVAPEPPVCGPDTLAESASSMETVD